MTTTVQQALRDAMQQLQDRVEDPYTDSQVLLAHLLAKGRAWILAHGDEVLAAAVVDDYLAMIDRRRRGVPVAHITGSREFWSMPFTVTADTLIPRPETEHLVEQSLALPLPAQARVLDYGTGSGVIAVVLAKERPQWAITAVDCSPAALAVARENAQRHQVAVTFVQACALDCFTGQAFDLIVSNPPYVRQDDPHLQQGDVRHEPAVALAAGADGLDCIRDLVTKAGTCLAPAGTLMLEHGYDQAAAVRRLLTGQGFVGVSTLRDLAGHERLTHGQWPVA
jgi:release factor glutamine methyltransferase